MVREEERRTDGAGGREWIMDYGDGDGMTEAGAERHVRCHVGRVSHNGLARGPTRQIGGLRALK